MKIIIHRNEILAALLFASKDASRYVLNGINFESKKDKPPLLVATDGRRLAVIESSQPQDVTEDHSFIVASHFLSIIVSTSKAIAKQHPSIQLENEKESSHLKVTFLCPNAFTMDVPKAAIVMALYPSWRQVTPKSLTRSTVGQITLSPEIVGDFARAAKLLNGSSDGVSLNLRDENAPVEVKLNKVANFYGVIMPMRGATDIQYKPSFLGILDAPEVVESKAA